ncbi:hypothetical protein KBZ33_18600 [Cyanobium sp. Cruz-8D1]|uniref:vanadium-dependent haloperoxidase n=2 Tax=unclassified Cyanobium TaxID=2627006 RepID=UPI0020CEA33F|nr:vanadium-dependent haloperoxidase [Cyanobium sp. Cruz-8D1]MCP9861048.1 hypothetical protein [Cyanobium sp. Cruz-8H5]MCP9868278.1 hypothetical protein [Cyanobium sp. Cruz-8D1]
MPAASKAMRFWVNVSLECSRRDHTPAFGSGDQTGPFMTSRALGMALGALYDGYITTLGGQSLLLKTPPPLPALPGSQCMESCANLSAAAACHEVLIHRYPKQASSLNEAWAFWTRLFISILPPDQEPWELYGRMVGDAIHHLGIKDRNARGPGNFVPGGPYTHNVPPEEPDQKFAGSIWGTAKYLLIDEITDFAEPPGRISATSVQPDAHFAADFKKVQVKGALQDRQRTQDEEVIGIYWGYDGPPELGTPPRLYMQVVLAVLDEIQSRHPDGLSEQDELLIIAATALAMADAAIEAWRYKYSEDHMMWRPVLGIRHGLGNLAPPEPGWRPLGRPDTNRSGVGLTPDFPAYPSGHATFGAAAFQLLRTFLVHKLDQASFTPEGLDNLAFCFLSDEYNGRNRDPRGDKEPRPKLPRSYSSLWDAIIDNSVSRVYIGVHWQFDGVTIKGNDPKGDFGIPSVPIELGRRGGVWLGCQVANQVALKINIPQAVINDSKVADPA